MRHDVSDEMLNCFVDDQLDSPEKSAILDSIDRDPALAERVNQLRAMKERIRHAYQSPPPGKSVAGAPRRPPLRHLQPLVACLLLLIGCALGWLLAELHGQGNGLQMPSGIYQAINRNDIVAEPRKIIIQVSDSSPVRLKSALDEIENLLATHRQLKLEVVANGGGVDLLRRDASPYIERVASIRQRGVEFMACSQTLKKLRDRGIEVRLLPHTGIVSSAAEQINQRLLQGWDYVRV